MAATVDVEVPVRTAYNQWTQFESFPHFMEGVEAVDQLDDRHTHWRVHVGPSTREFDATITEQHPDERIAWKSDSGPKHAGVVTFHRLDDTHTRVTAQMDVDPEGFVENVADKLGVLKHRVSGDLERFKHFVEERGSETGAWRGDIPRPGAADTATERGATPRPGAGQTGTPGVGGTGTPGMGGTGTPGVGGTPGTGGTGTWPGGTTRP
ncbi:putative 17.2 kDa protein in melC2-rnhH intergenic region [Nocardia gamkensis]|nr:putative 17.2 kDa protein in melC2-rnhH intergenic region [Nocardia gamkensis]